MVVTAATPRVWKAVRLDHEKVLTLPALREYATTTKQVCFRELRDVHLIHRSYFQAHGVFNEVFFFCVYFLQEITQMPIIALMTRRRMG